MKRFKIDYYDSSYMPFALYFAHPRWFGTVSWRVIDRFPTRDECKALYDKIKDLPEYLD